MKAYSENKKYLITKDGKVFGPRGWMEGTTDKDGYRIFNIGGKYIKGHRLVAETYIPNPEGKPIVCHLNHQKDDNRLENLQWGTHMENVEMSKEVNAYNGVPQPTRLKIATMYKTGRYTQRQLGVLFGIDGSVVNRIVKEFRNEDL